MIKIAEHIIEQTKLVSSALHMMNKLGKELTLFVVNEQSQLVGTLTDGDIRRGLLSGLNIDASISNFMQGNFQFLRLGKYNVNDVEKAKLAGVQILPVLDDNMHIKRLINFSYYKSYLPFSAIIMAGGEGVRLRPLTNDLPKPLLKVGNKPIIEYGVDWLIQHGVEDIKISVNYLSEKIMNYFGDGSTKNVSISYIQETSKLGTIGSVSLIEDLQHEHILIMNSDLLTNIDLEEFYKLHESRNAAMSIACVPYKVTIPYAILDTDHEKVLGLKEKPTLTYWSNAGIYLVKKEILTRIPKGEFFNATDLVESLLSDREKVAHYPILGYWLDIGKMDDFQKAQEDINYIKF